MGSKRPKDVVQSFVFSSLPLKAENQPERFDGWSSAVEEWLAGSDGSSSSGVSTASDFMKALVMARGQLLGLLQVTSSSAAEVTAAQAKFMGLLVELSTVEQQIQQAEGDTDPVLRSTWVDCILPLTAFSPDGSSSSSNSKWFHASARKRQAAATAAAVAATAATAPSSGFAYEAANALLAVATWKMAKAAALSMSQGGADSTLAMEGYQLYCQAAGVVDELRRKLLPLLGVGAGGDLSRELLSALHLFALGEAQNVMLQRAVALNYQGSTLAPMATDTAMLFSQAYDAVEAAAKTLQLPWTFLPPLETNSPSGSSSSSSSTADGSTTPSKNSRMAGFERVMSGQLPTEWPIEAVPLLQLAAYVQYQAGHCYSLASICAAETALSSNQAGQAVALAQLGTNLCEQLADLGFEQSGFIDPVSTLGARDSSRRLALQATLEQKAANVLRRCVRENRTIYLQYVPDSPSALPWPQRSAQPEIYRLPTPQGSISSSTVKGLRTAAAVGSLCSFQDPTAEAAAAAENPPPRAAAAAAVIEPPVAHSRSSRGRHVISPRLIDHIQPNSLAHMADETAAAVAAATAAAATAAASMAGYMSPLSAAAAAADAQAEADHDCDNPEEGPSYADETAAAAAAEAPLSLALDSSSYSAAAAAKVKGDVSVDGGAASPVSSYTLTAGQDIGSTTSTAGSSSSSRSRSDSGGSTASRRDSSSSGGSAVSSSSSRGNRWSQEDFAGSTDHGSSGGLGGLVKGLFGCCLTPSGASMSEDGGSDSEDDSSSHDQEREEMYEDSWENPSEVSKQDWASKQQQWDN